MKHTVKITLIILSMFLLTQFIGLHVVDNYAKERVIDGVVVSVENSNQLPYGMEIPETKSVDDYDNNFISILISFIIAIAVLFLLTKVKSKIVMRTWFFFVTVLAIGISLTAILPKWQAVSYIALGLAVILALGKIFRRSFISHNLSELLIYPGIAAVFVPLLNLKTMIILLVIISIYDMWAVWKSGIMQKMAKYQMDELKIFSGFFVPYASKIQRAKIAKMSKKDIKTKGVKVSAAILGGGDVIFPIITAGVIMKTWGIFPAIGIIFGALLGLSLLLFFSEKKKFYPAMPFITAGIFLAMLISWLLI